MAIKQIVIKIEIKSDADPQIMAGLGAITSALNFFYPDQNKSRLEVIESAEKVLTELKDKILKEDFDSAA